MPLLDHFGLLAPFYERLIPLQEDKPLWEYLQLPVDGPVLDAGGGTGRVAVTLKDSAPQIVVADESFKMLQEAARKDGLQPVGTQAERLPFPDDTFVRVLMVDAFHHVANQEHTLAELWRVLAPGGLLVIEEPDIRTWTVKGIALMEKVTLMRSHFLSPARIVALLPADEASVEVHTGDFNAWIVARK